MTQSTSQIYKVNNNTVFLLSLDILKLNYDNAQKRMADYHQQARETTERAYKVIAILFPGPNGLQIILCRIAGP